MNFSKDTLKQVATCKTFEAALKQLEGPAAECLADDRGDIDKIAATLGTIYAKRDILAARLERRKVELFDLVKRDVAQAYDEAAETDTKAKDALRRAKADWEQNVRSKFSTEKAKAILMDGSLIPSVIVEAQNRADEAHKARLAISAIREGVDEAWLWAHMPSDAKTPRYQRLNAWTPPDFLANAMRAAGVEHQAATVKAAGTVVRMRD